MYNYEAYVRLKQRGRCKWATGDDNFTSASPVEPCSSFAGLPLTDLDISREPVVNVTLISSIHKGDVKTTADPSKKTFVVDVDPVPSSAVGLTLGGTRYGTSRVYASTLHIVSFSTTKSRRNAPDAGVENENLFTATSEWVGRGGWSPWNPFEELLGALLC